MKRVLFNDGWICTESSGTALDAMFGFEAAAKPEAVNLPHDAVIHTKRFDYKKGNGMGFYKGTNVVYRKTFTMPIEDADKVVWLEFEGMYQNGFVFINNSYAGRCTYGYGNYYINATKFIKFGGKNEIKVIVKNGVLSGRWYTGGGIYRDVSILTGNQLHIKCEGTRITTKDIDEGLAVIYAETPVEYVGFKTIECFVSNEIFDAQGELVASDKSPVTMYEHETKDVSQRIEITNPKLWDVDHPYLYTCRTKLIINGEVIDEDESTFGVRKLQLDSKHGLRINGKTVKLRGGCVHHDNGVIGAVTFEKAEERRVLRLKEAGFNAIRTGAHPMGKGFIKACDKIGMLVVEEFSDVWTTAKVEFDYNFNFDLMWEQDVTNMVNKNYNHPSVIMYSIGCEIPETANKFDRDLVRKIVDKIRSIDKTRYLTFSLNLLLCSFDYMEEIMADLSIAEDGTPREINTMMATMYDMNGPVANHPIIRRMTEEACAGVDVVGFNYTNRSYESAHEMFPNRIMFGSEAFPPDLAKNWAIVEKNPYVLGDFCWAAWDYLGEAGIGRVYYGEKSGGFYGDWPWRSAYCGVINLIGERLPISYWREIVWGLRKAPYIAVRPPEHFGQEPNVNNWTWISDSISSWNWPGYENKPVTVEVFSGAEEVELFINGKSVGKKKTGEKIENCAIFDTVYSPGEIKAVASNKQEFVLKTAKGDNNIVIRAEEKEIEANGRGIAFIEISLCDKDGLVNPASAKKVSIEVEGAGSLLGFGSANPKCEEDFFANECAAFEGRALAVVRSGENKGKINVTVNADGCDPKKVTIDVV